MPHAKSKIATARSKPSSFPHSGQHPAQAQLWPQMTITHASRGKSQPPQLPHPTVQTVCVVVVVVGQRWLKRRPSGGPRDADHSPRRQRMSLSGRVVSKKAALSPKAKTTDLEPRVLEKTSSGWGVSMGGSKSPLLMACPFFGVPRCRRGEGL